MSAVELILPRLKTEEGFRSRAYRDTVGKLTIGLRMRPCLTISGSANGWQRDAELFSEKGQASTFPLCRSNFANRCHRESGHAVLFSKKAWCRKFRAMTYRVCLISLVCVPSKIIEAVVRWITITMTCLHSFRTWANECNQNQRMYSGDMRFPIYAWVHKHALKPIPAVIRDRFQNAFALPVIALRSMSPTTQRFYSAFSACLITREAGDISPFLHEDHSNL